jgi:hypothetical protein
MIGAIARLLLVRGAARGDIETGVGDIARRRGTTALIGDDSQALTFGGKAQDRFDKVLAIGL